MQAKIQFFDPDEPEYTYTHEFFHEDAESTLKILPGLMVMEIFRGFQNRGHILYLYTYLSYMPQYLHQNRSFLDFSFPHTRTSISLRKVPETGRNQLFGPTPRLPHITLWS